MRSEKNDTSIEKYEKLSYEEEGRKGDSSWREVEV